MMILYYLVYIAAALFLLKAVYNWLHAIVLRVALFFKLKKICRRRNYALEKPRNIFASFFRCSAKPDLIIRTGDADYLVRVITCRARKRLYHFVNHEWFVRVLRYYILSLAFHSGTPVTLSKSAKHLPPLDESFLTDAKAKVVLLFNPSPLEITFTTCSSRRQIGSNGSDFDGWLIYNGKAFVRMLDGDNTGQ